MRADWIEVSNQGIQSEGEEMWSKWKIWKGSQKKSPNGRRYPLTRIVSEAESSASAAQKLGTSTQAVSWTFRFRDRSTMRSWQRVSPRSTTGYPAQAGWRFALRAIKTSSTRSGSCGCRIYVMRSRALLTLAHCLSRRAKRCNWAPISSLCSNSSCPKGQANHWQPETKIGSVKCAAENMRILCRPLSI